MEQMKIFSRGLTAAENPGDPLEEKINEWMKDHAGITIVQREVRTCSGINLSGEPFINLTIVIFYKEQVSG